MMVRARAWARASPRGTWRRWRCMVFLLHSSISIILLAVHFFDSDLYQSASLYTVVQEYHEQRFAGFVHPHHSSFASDLDLNGGWIDGLDSARSMLIDIFFPRPHRKG